MVKIDWTLTARLFTMIEPYSSGYKDSKDPTIDESLTVADTTLTWTGGFGIPNELHPALEYRPKTVPRQAEEGDVSAKAAEFAHGVILACSHGSGADGVVYSGEPLPPGHCVGDDDRWYSDTRCVNFIIAKKKAGGTKELVRIEGFWIGNQKFTAYFGVGVHWRKR